MPNDIKIQINKMYGDVEKAGRESLSQPTGINERIHEHQREMMKKKEAIIIKALGRVNPSLAIEIEGASKTKRLGLLKGLVHKARLEVEHRPHGEEVYSCNGDGFLRITREDEVKENGIETIVKYDLI